MQKFFVKNLKSKRPPFGDLAVYEWISLGKRGELLGAGVGLVSDDGCASSHHALTAVIPLVLLGGAFHIDNELANEAVILVTSDVLGEDQHGTLSAALPAECFHAEQTVMIVVEIGGEVGHGSVVDKAVFPVIVLHVQEDYVATKGVMICIGAAMIGGGSDAVQSGDDFVFRARGAMGVQLDAIFDVHFIVF